MNLDRLGATPQLRASLAPDLTLARVTVSNRDQYRLIADSGDFDAEPSGALWYNAATRAAMPVVGDWVAARVINAEQAIVASGRLPGRITIRSRDLDGRVLLEVEDTGPGIPGDNEAKLFQPFFTTKPVGQGTGLGLSISYGIIDSLGGRIGYRSAPAGGAVFYFDLPPASAEAA